jgi:molybdopterin-binding protein
MRFSLFSNEAMGYTYANATVERERRCRYDCVPMQKNAESEGNAEGLLKPREAAVQLGISFPTIKQWIYTKKIRSNQTAGGHHRIPQSEVDRLLFRTRGKTEQQREEEIRRVSGRNQLVGRIESVQISGLMAEVRVSIGGQQITSIITVVMLPIEPGLTRVPTSS